MSQPVKLSDVLVLDARMAAEAEQRSIAGQVEYWSKLGRMVDAVIDGRVRADLLQTRASKPLSELVAGVGTAEGASRLKAHLDSEPFPRFAPHPVRKGLLIRTDADGSSTVGRFVNREFVPVSRPSRAHAAATDSNARGTRKRAARTRRPPTSQRSKSTVTV